MAHAAVFIAM